MLYLHTLHIFMYYVIACKAFWISNVYIQYILLCWRLMHCRAVVNFSNLGGRGRIVINYPFFFSSPNPKIQGDKGPKAPPPSLQRRLWIVYIITKLHMYMTATGVHLYWNFQQTLQYFIHTVKNLYYVCGKIPIQNNIGRIHLICLVLSQVPKCFGLVQILCARPKNV